jgi:hypothetical protein
MDKTKEAIWKIIYYKETIQNGKSKEDAEKIANQKTESLKSK